MKSRNKLAHVVQACCELMLSIFCRLRPHESVLKGIAAAGLAASLLFASPVEAKIGNTQVWHPLLNAFRLAGHIASKCWAGHLTAPYIGYKSVHALAGRPPHGAARAERWQR